MYSCIAENIKVGIIRIKDLVAQVNSHMLHKASSFKIMVPVSLQYLETQYIPMLSEPDY